MLKTAWTSLLINKIVDDKLLYIYKVVKDFDQATVKRYVSNADTEQLTLSTLAARQKLADGRVKVKRSTHHTGHQIPNADRL